MEPQNSSPRTPGLRRSSTPAPSRQSRGPPRASPPQAAAPPRAGLREPSPGTRFRQVPPLMATSVSVVAVLKRVFRQHTAAIIVLPSNWKCRDYTLPQQRYCAAVKTNYNKSPAFNLIRMVWGAGLGRVSRAYSEARRPLQPSAEWLVRPDLRHPAGCVNPPAPECEPLRSKRLSVAM